MFASKNSVVASALDAIGMGIGFTSALFIIGSIREFIGSGTWMGIVITADIITPMTIFMLAPGGFFVYGVLIALINYLSKGRAIKKTEMGCENCPSNNVCHNNQKEGA
jgi:electron transport complex protein RnfE